MGKKKFIDKKKSATFQLLARDSSDPNYDETPGSDRIFVRVDNNPVTLGSFIGSDEAYGGGEDDPNSIFDDAPEDYEDDESDDRVLGNSMLGWSGNMEAQPLPEHVRREILDLGFPDDGYNYLLHLREIKNTGGGSAFYHNPKFRAEYVPRDVKAYDASRLQISEVNEELDEKSIYSVASKSTNVRIQKGVDPEVAALLDDSDVSRFGSDVEDLEEDFVVQANLPEGEEEEEEEEEKLHMSDRINSEVVINKNNSGSSKVVDDLGSVKAVTNGVAGVDYVNEKPRVRRLLDEQFDLLESREYGTDDDDDYDCYRAEEDESLAEKLKRTLNDHVVDNVVLNDDNYKVLGKLVKDEEQEDCGTDVILRCKEYAERYENDNEDKDVVFEESSEESEVWDCETIVSTYSNLDNHPGKIEAPEVTRRKRLSQTVSAALSSCTPVISLKGKEKLPVDFLPGSKKPAPEKVKDVGATRTEQSKRKQHGQESKEEKKERKAAVKEERREARRVKKEMKGLYKCETHRAQRVAAVSGPSTIHLMNICRDMAVLLGLVLAYTVHSSLLSIFASSRMC
ncbi:protein LTV1-like protein [Senna tora]|uniref:Protein LTV1-like protein n=1 Tax=Senna tora TaxID=362788 RepID=A0A834WW90_9FABA|nr:protein LTV1-like protein [Senna tora]